MTENELADLGQAGTKKSRYGRLYEILIEDKVLTESTKFVMRYYGATNGFHTRVQFPLGIFSKAEEEVLMDSLTIDYQIGIEEYERKRKNSTK